MAANNYKDIKIESEAIEAIKSFALPSDLSFGKVLAPVMIEADYDNGKWSELKLVPYRSLQLDPTCKVLHYGQEIFEGMKAYHTKGAGPFLFRPDQNAERFNLSAKRMAMPEIPISDFLNGVEALTSYCSNFIPKRSGDSLYIRPFMYASENNLGIKPSEKFKFLIVASPSAAYFSSGSVRVLVEEDAIRACPGGVGAAKTGGNYAASLLSMIEAKKKGFHQVLWLDALHKENIEEMSGMNFFAVYEDGIRTPNLTATILDGITRKSIIKMAEHLGINVSQEEMKIKDLIEDIKSGKCSECFACGTAVIITPIDTLGLASGDHYPLTHSFGPTTQKLREALLNLQEGTGEDPFEWRIKLEAVSL
jgi:branched-chain amino acid aminotransferase